MKKKDKTLKKRATEKLNNLPPVEKMASPKYPTFEEVYLYSMTEMKFLEEYKKDLDPYRAGKEVRITRDMVNKYLNNEKITKVMGRIHEAYIDAIMMDTKVAAGRFMNILDKLEKSFDNGEAKVASALANMAGNLLRATGHFGSEDKGKASVVQINIDLGKDQPTEKLKVVSGKTNILN